MSQSKTSRGLSFKFKLIGLCIFMASVSGVIGAISYKGLNDTAAVSLTITDEVMPKLAHVNEMFVNFRHIRIELRTLALPGISTAQAKLATQGTLDTIAAYEKAMALYEKEGFEPGQRELYDNVAANWKAFKAIGQRVLELEKSGTPEDRKNMVAIFFEDCPKTAQSYTVAMTKLLEFHKTVASNRAAQSKATASRTDSLVLMVLFLGVAAGLSVGIVFSTRVSNSISVVTEALAKSVENVTSTSTEIASSSNKLASASSQQASSLQQTAASLEEISAMIAKASESAGATASSSTESQNKAESGRKTVGEMLGSIHDISQSNDAIMIEVNKSNAQMTEIVSVIHGIGEKTKVINDIVFQTKLLSFNASVEAARAGEHGKGFAVVAEEVGKLAQMSGNAAKEISEMLESSVRTVEKIAQDTKTKVEALIAQGKLKVDSGVTVARECSGILENIVDNVTVVSALALEISQATKEQALGVSEINKAMGQLDAVTNQNAALSEEAATSAKHLSIEAVALREAVTQLVTLVHGREPASERTNLHHVEVEATSEHHLRAA